MKTLKQIRAERVFTKVINEYKELFCALCDCIAAVESGQIHPKKALKLYQLGYPRLCRYGRWASSIEANYLGTEKFVSDTSHIYAFFTV